jgi:hypothetical protein
MVLLIVAAAILVLFLAYVFIINSMLNKDSFKKQIIESRLQLKFPESAEVESFTIYNENVAISLLFRKAVALRAVVIIDKSDEDLLRKQLTYPPWKAGNDEFQWQGSYWQGYELDNAIELYHQSLPVYFQKSEGSAYVAMFPGNEDNKLVIGLNFIG